jgi:hypothetical protein
MRSISRRKVEKAIWCDGGRFGLDDVSNGRSHGPDWLAVVWEHDFLFQRDSDFQWLDSPQPRFLDHEEESSGIEDRGKRRREISTGRYLLGSLV